MRYLMAYIYLLLSGVGVPFVLQAHDLIGRDYVTLAGDITASLLLEELFFLSSPFCALFFVLQALMLLLLPIQTSQRLRRTLNGLSLPLLGFASASLALTDHTQVYGTTWTGMEAFIAFVVPVWPAILIIIGIGAYLGRRFEEDISQPRPDPDGSLGLGC